jgi:hypothetical protein
MPPRTAVVVGNGLTIDLMTHGARTLLTEWDPSSPLSWKVQTHDMRELRDCLPRFFDAVNSVRATHPNKTDFFVLDEIVRRAATQRAEADALDWPAASRPGFEAGALDAEARHFLGLSYSALDMTLRRACRVDGWRWLHYFEGLGDDLLAVMSFNYDTVIERVLESVGLRFFHCGIEPHAGLPLGKPHGSVDYALSDNIIHLGREPEYPISIALTRIDAPMRRLPAAELAKPRLHVEVVPPMAATQIRCFQWVWPIFDAFTQLGPAIERCVFLGLSGWPVDQPELCDVLRALNPTTEVVVANPDPNAAVVFDFHARRLGLGPVIRWSDGPRP